MTYALIPVFQSNSIGLSLWSIFIALQFLFVSIALIQMLLTNYREKQVFSALDFLLVLFAPIIGVIYVAIKFMNFKKSRLV